MDGAFEGPGTLLPAHLPPHIMDLKQSGFDYIAIAMQGHDAETTSPIALTETAPPASSLGVFGGGSREGTSGGGSANDSSSLSELSCLSGSGGGGVPLPSGGQPYNGHQQYSRGDGGAADGSEITAGMADLFMSFTSPLVNIAELLLSTTAQIGGRPAAAMRRATAVEVSVDGVGGGSYAPIDSAFLLSRASRLLHVTYRCPVPL